MLDSDSSTPRIPPARPPCVSWVTLGSLGALYVVLCAVVFADVWLHNPPPYVYTIGTETRPYDQWYAEQPALAWFWAGRPVWDAPVWLRVLWMLGVLGLMSWKKPAEALRAWMARGRDLAGSRVPTVVVLVLAAGALWTFRSRDLRYGDSQFLTDLVPREVKSVGANIAYEEILDCTLHCRGYYHLNRLFGWDIVRVFQVLGVAATVVGLAIVWPRWRRWPGAPAALILALWYATGWSNVFFGHIEYYTLVAVALMVYATVAMDHLEGRRGAPFWLCCFLAGLAACFHMVAGWMWPTLVVLFWHELRRPGQRFWRLFGPGAAAFLLPIVASVGIATAYGFGPDRFGNTHLAHLKFIFLLTPENAAAGHRAIYHYAFLSGTHLRDVANELVQVAWPGLVLTVGLILPAIRNRLWNRPTVQFWLVAALGFQAFCLVWNSDLGFIRDWDLFGVVALGWTGLGIEWVRQLNREESVAGAAAESILAQVVLFALATALPMRILQMLHHSWWVGPVNQAGLF